METTIQVQNLKCGGCAATIKNKVSELEAVNAVEIDEMQGAVMIVHTEESVLLKVKQKLAALGYPEIDAQNSLLSQAKSFVSCAVGRLSK